ncbi:MAG: hypothetical protein EA411_01240 [Saprospirales bacterium]|nr:MAG: hypothetical protein EA411_01240 [Saprospirales bacterium]
MRRKYKLTGCARFLIFLLIAGPVIYISATLITGTSPWEELKATMGWGEETEEVEQAPPATTDQADTLDPEDYEREMESDDQSAETTPTPETKPEATTQADPTIQELKERIEGLEERIRQLESDQ